MTLLTWADSDHPQEERAPMVVEDLEAARRDNEEPCDEIGVTAVHFSTSHEILRRRRLMRRRGQDGHGTEDTPSIQLSWFLCSPNNHLQSQHQDHSTENMTAPSWEDTASKTFLTWADSKIGSNKSNNFHQKTDLGKFCKGTRFMRVVEVGQCFMTKDTGDFLQTVACREYTLPRSLLGQVFPQNNSFCEKKH